MTNLDNAPQPQIDEDYGDCVVCNLPIGDVYACSNHDLDRCTFEETGSCFCGGYVHPDCCPVCKPTAEQIITNVTAEWELLDDDDVAERGTFAGEVARALREAGLLPKDDNG